MEKQILNEQEEIAIRRLIADDVTMTALEKLLLVDVYSYGVLEPGAKPDPTRNFALSLLLDPMTGSEYALDNDKLGAKLRACIEAIRMVQIAFNRIKSYKQEKVEEKPKTNPAR